MTLMSAEAYYNEIDPLKAEVLREAVRAGSVAKGDVDERSIEEVQPSDLMGYTQCHFFAGGGFWSLALRLAGWPDDRPVWTGSCPCPSFSAAGKGGGFDDPRHLWPAWFKLIRECRPSVVFGEQADDAVGYGWLDLVQSDLEAQTYAVGKAILGACSVGAPHMRQRLYFFGEDLHLHAGMRLRESRHESSLGELRVSRAQPQSETSSRMPNPSHAGISDAFELADAEEAVRGRSGDAPIGGRRASQIRGSSHAVQLEHPAGNGRTAQRNGDAGESGGLVDANSKPGERNARSISGTQAALSSEGFNHGNMRERHSDAGPVNGFWRDAEWIPCRVPEVPGAVEWRAIERGTFALAARYPQRVAELRLAGDAINIEVAQAFIEAYLEVEIDQNFHKGENREATS